MVNRRSPVARALSPAIGLGLGLALSACGGGREATEKQLEALQSEITKLRAETAILTERLDAVELAQGTSRGSKGGRASAASPADKAGGSGEDRPELTVVKLAPEGSTSASSGGGADVGAGEDADGDDAPRPILRSVSGGGVIEDRTAPQAKGSEAAQRDYDKALELYRARSYDKALEAFTAFLSRYPGDELADNASYWRGESYLSKGDARRAAEQFDAVVKTYPKGNKAPDALLRLAQCLSTLGDAAGADAARKKLRTTYPSSDAAKKLERPGKSSPAPKGTSEVQ